MKHKLILSTILIIVLSLFALDVMPSTAVSTGVAILFHTSLDDIAAIESPAVGIGGSTTLGAGDFVAAQTGNGANFTGEGKVAVFPATDGGTQNIKLAQGEVEFWYRPTYDAGADDVIHYLLVVGQVDNVPHLILREADTLQLSLTDGNWNSYLTQAPWRAPLWEANQWVHIRATWDSASNDPLRLYVDGERVDDGAKDNGWDLGSEADIGSIFVGGGDNNGLFSAEGVMDELIIRDTPQVPPTATPTNTPDPDKPTNTPTATATPLSAGGITDPDLVLTAAPLSRPAYNSTVMEPVFGTSMRRVTDEYANGGFGTQIYSQLQAFSPDNSHLLVIETGGYVVRRLDNLSQVHIETASWNAPRWHSGLPNTIVHYDSNEDKTLRVQYTDVASQQTSTVFTFPAQYQRIRSNQSFDELSHDGRWMAGMASREDGVQVIFALDLENQSLGAQLAISDLYATACEPEPTWGEVEPDWVGVSPLGNYLVVQWERDGTTRCSGLETFNLTTGAFVGRVYDGHAHGDLGVLPNSTTEFFMTFELSNPDAGGLLSIGYRELPGTSTVSPPTYLLVMDWNGAHISCQGPNGLCLVTNDKDESNGWSALEGELFLLSTNGDVRRLAHHRSSSCDYWVQPRASLSRDGRYVIFASDWEQETGVDGCDTEKYLGRGDAYVIDLETSIPPNTPTPTATSMPGGQTRLYLPLIIRAGATTPATSTPTATIAAATSTPTATATQTTGNVYNGNPDNYRDLLAALQPGDTLLLEAGTYTQGLPFDNMNGTAQAPIIVSGPENGARAVFLARTCCNTVSFRDSSYIEIHNLELDGQDLAGVDAVKAEGDANWAHHITLENLYIHSHDASQQTVGISTKCPAWDWVIRRNIIDSAGTGIYLGDSNGDAPFVNGLIEGNLIVDTVGYNMQIKHQNPRPDIAGMPTGENSTIIRHNVFSKANNASTGGDARPNLLVGHWPLSGVGQNDLYEIYGNFFWQNPSGEPLFQGEGNIALYNNLFVNSNGDAIWIQPHNDIPKMIRTFNNTILASGTGIRVSGGDANFEQKVIANAAFATTAINADDQTDNITDSFANASTYLTNPFAALGQLDLYPQTGTLTGTAIDTSSFNSFSDWNQGFNGNTHDGTLRGAYAGEGTNPGWLPQLERKPLE